MSQRSLLSSAFATRVKKQRRRLDAYYTPPWITQVLMDRCPEVRGERLLDPCCGDGRMSHQLRAAGRFGECWLNDVDPENRVAVRHTDACDPSLYEPPPDWVVTNPPFVHAGRIAWTALQHARRGVALLLRISFLEPVESRQWLKRLPPTRLISLSRVSFDGSGQTDSATCAWFLWLRDEGGEWQRGTVETADHDPRQESLL